MPPTPDAQAADVTNATEAMTLVPIPMRHHVWTKCVVFCHDPDKPGNALAQFHAALAMVVEKAVEDDRKGRAAEPEKSGGGFERQIACPECNGSGWRPITPASDHLVPCLHCFRGKVVFEPPAAPPDTPPDPAPAHSSPRSRLRLALSARLTDLTDERFESIAAGLINLMEHPDAEAIRLVLDLITTTQTERTIS